MSVWPNFFIIGVDRGGTTSLYEYLKNIPEIFMSTPKEPWYFSPVVRSVTPQAIGKCNSEKSYLNLFKNVKNETVIGEASAVYWRDPESAKLIHEKIPNAKIIIVTASIDSDIEQKLVEENASAIIWKPFDMEKVQKTIERVKNGESKIILR